MYPFLCEVPITSKIHMSIFRIMTNEATKAVNSSNYRL